MEIKQILYFREIVRQGSISKAAEALHIAQPPLSQMLKRLENDLGTTLINRHKKRWELTETGELIYRFAERFLAQLDEVKQQIYEIERGITGVVNIGVSIVCANFLPDYISLFRSINQTVKLNITTGSSDELLDKLKRKELDLTLLLRPGELDQFYVKSVGKESFVLAIATDCLRSNDADPFPKMEFLSSLPLIMLGPTMGYSFYERILELFKEQNFEPDVIIECKDVNMVLNLVAKGLGISIIPSVEHRASSVFTNVSFLEFNQLDYFIEPVFLRLKDESPSKALLQFWEVIKDNPIK